MTDRAPRYNLLIAAALIALGLILGGWLLGTSIARVKLADRAVTVRGLAERDVIADLATWTISYSSTGTEVSAAQAKIDADTAAIRSFLKRYGFDAEEVAPAGVSVNQWVDNNPAYGPGGRRSVTVRQRLQLRTTKVMAARRAAANVSELIRTGVVLEDGSNVVYNFTRLDSVKPQMIATATRDARRGAEQFAKDSGATVGGIKSASQGYFSIGSRDGDPAGERGNGGSGIDTPFKKVRVVTTIDFYLED